MPLNSAPAPVIATPPTAHPAPLALYAHIPFCQTRCTYCAFNTYAGMASRIPPYVSALLSEIRAVGSAGERPPASALYFGGGTPSQLPADAVRQIVQTCAQSFALDPSAEISLETNPGDADGETFRALRQAGVNRLSVGMQSAHADELRLFARRHNFAAVQNTVRLAREAGFSSINLDLIYGIPGQSMSQWQHSLEAALSLEPDHLSLYSLSIEEGTPLHARLLSGRLAAPDPDLAADMIEWAADRLPHAGLAQYEISNWAAPGHACQHNLHIWRNEPYLGFGAGAHGCAARVRYENIASPDAYIARLSAPAETPSFPLSAAAAATAVVDAAEEMADTMILGLRLTAEGVDQATFRARFGRELWDVYGAALDRLLAHDLIERSATGAVRLTKRGCLLGNHVFCEFI